MIRAIEGADKAMAESDAANERIKKRQKWLDAQEQGQNKSS